MTRTCGRPHCDGPYYALDLCLMHYARMRRRRKQPRVELAPVVAHLRRLNAFGWSCSAVAIATGSATDTICRILRGDVRSVAKDRVDRILALPATYQDSTVSVSFIGTGRRLAAFNYAGYPSSTIAGLLGRRQAVFRNPKLQGRVESGLALAVAELYAKWAGGVDEFGRPRVLPGWPEPSPSQAKHARSRGAIPAAAWDAETIDDPEAQPQEVADPGLRYGGRVDLDEVQRQRKFGESDHQIAKSLGVEVKSIQDAELRSRKGAA